MDVIDPRIDVGAQRAILRMRAGDPAAKADGETLLAAVKTGRVSGIYGDDLRAAAQLAARRGTVRWELVPRGRDAAMVEDPAGPPAVIFREGAREDRYRLDPALRAIAPALRPGGPGGGVPPGVPVLVPLDDGTAGWFEKPRPRPGGDVLAEILGENVGPNDTCPNRCGTVTAGPNATVVPWLVRIEATFSLGGVLGRVASGSGALIGPCHVLTAGHVLHSLVQRSPGTVTQQNANAVKVFVADRPGLPSSGANIRNAVRFRAALHWVLSGATSSRHDYGLVTLDRPVTGQVGRWRVPATTALPAGLAVATGGYSGMCPPHRRQHFRDGAVRDGTDVVRLGFESSSGHSGSAVWTRDGGRPTLRGVVVSTQEVRSTDTGRCDSFAVAIRADLLAELRGWVEQDVADGLCGRRRPAIDLASAAVR